MWTLSSLERSPNIQGDLCTGLIPIWLCTLTPLLPPACHTVHLGYVYIGIVVSHLSTVPAVVSASEEVERFQTAVTLPPLHIRHPVGRLCMCRQQQETRRSRRDKMHSTHSLQSARHSEHVCAIMTTCTVSLSGPVEWLLVMYQVQ